jgi:SAM-dependent methyltransferase
MTSEFPVIADRIVEPLAESAPIQWQLAQQLCTENCRWYHGPRLYLRALGIIRGVRSDTPFLLDALGHVARGTERAHVLVSGAADYGTLSHVIAAWAEAGRALTVTVVDKCLTPLRMNSWLGERAGVPVHVHHGDLFDFEAEQAFDAICTHAFVGRFDAAGRRRLAEKWHAMLKPGGAVVTANGLRRAGPAGEVPFAFRQRQRILERAHQALSVPGAVDATPDLIAKWTSEFLRRKTTHPVYSTAEVEGPLTAAGFSVSISREPSEGSWRMGVVAIKRS